MVRVVLDTNVLISALLFGGPPGILLKLILEYQLGLLVSTDLLIELERVLHTKFPHAQQAVWETVSTLKEMSTITIPMERIEAIHQDPSDNHVLECAVSGQADAMISGDRHLLALKTFRGIPILSPHAFLEQWRSGRH
jgi:putative PIN family toxin of toxin-antitoxin system